MSVQFTFFNGEFFSVVCSINIYLPLLRFIDAVVEGGLSIGYDLVVASLSLSHRLLVVLCEFLVAIITLWSLCFNL